MFRDSVCPLEALVKLDVQKDSYLLGIGEEFIFLIEGELEMVYEGERYHLSAGDCIFLNGKVPHGGRARGRKKAVALLISSGA